MGIIVIEPGSVASSFVLKCPSYLDRLWKKIGMTFLLDFGSYNYYIEEIYTHRLYDNDQQRLDY